MGSKQGVPSNLGLGWGAENSPPQKSITLKNVTQGLRLGSDCYEHDTEPSSSIKGWEFLG